MTVTRNELPTVDSRSHRGEDRSRSIIRNDRHNGLACRAIAVIIIAVGSACAVARVDSPSDDTNHEYLHEAAYHVSCNISDECRVTYIDDVSTLRAKDITGDWDYEFGVDPGNRLWVRATAAGCPPRSVLVEIQIDGVTMAEHLARSPGGMRCDWILAETEFRVP